MIKEKEYTVDRIEGLTEVGRSLLERHPDARVFALYGAMGVGKTTFVKSIGRLLGVSDMITSPSFPVINHYITSNGDSLYHFDFFRIKSIEEVYDLGYEDYLYSGSYCFIEWPERAEQLMPSEVVRILMEEKDGIRFIRF